MEMYVGLDVHSKSSVFVIQDADGAARALRIVAAASQRPEEEEEEEDDDEEDDGEKEEKEEDESRREVRDGDRQKQNEGLPR